jgi:hypothetical protein
MRTTIKNIHQNGVGVAAVFFLSASLSSAQTFMLEGAALSGGGGPTTGGAFSLNGTIGQPATDSSRGGEFTLQSGLWSAFATEPPGDIPSLRIARSGWNIVLAWPDPSSGFQLQESLSVASPNWMSVNVVPAVVGSEKQVTQTLAPGARFYRLHRP